MQIRTSYITIFTLLIYSVGIIGVSLEITRDFFNALSPLNLLLTGLILLLFVVDFKKSFVGLVIIFLIGMVIEIVGVQTGLVFGPYYYGKTLGIKILEVPIIIGLNWILLTTLSNALAAKFSSKTFIQIVLGACIMVMTDFFIEPVAIALDYWHWGDQNSNLNHIPTTNYVAWFIISIVTCSIANKFVLTKNKTLGINILFILIIFFVVLNFTL